VSYDTHAQCGNSCRGHVIWKNSESHDDVLHCFGANASSVARPTN